MPEDRPPLAPAEARERLEQALFEIRRVIAGQDAMLERVLVCLLAQGHLLIEGVPGLAKTLTIKTTAAVLGGIVRAHPVHARPRPVGPRRHAHLPRRTRATFDTELGPVFCNFLLADEINRAPAKVQSALLEVMQERQVTIGHDTHPVPDPFLVMATQNPIESEGTYPLPGGAGRPLHAQDPDRLPVARRGADDRPAAARARRRSCARRSRSTSCASSSATSSSVYVDPALISYAVTLADATRNPAAHGLDDLAPYISLRRQPARPDQPRPVGARARADPRPRLRRRRRRATRSPRTRSGTGSCSRTRRWPRR